MEELTPLNPPNLTNEERDNRHSGASASAGETEEEERQLLGGELRDERIWRPLRHSIVNSPVHLPSNVGGTFQLFLDLGRPIPDTDLESLRIELHDAAGTIHAITKEIEESDSIAESGWVNGTTYRVRVACPPRGLCLDSPCSVSATLGEHRFLVAIDSVRWVATLESNESSTTCSSDDLASNSHP